MKSRRTVVRSDPTAITCPTCGRSLLIDETVTPPFCSVRCQQIDLGRWLEEEIGVPHEGGDTLDDESGSREIP